MSCRDSRSRRLSKGFTLIELLVVIAIIGVLSAVVLTSLSSARSKGNDAAIQANLATIQVQSEIVYGTYNAYATSASSPAYIATGSCNATAGSLFADTTISRAISSARSSSGGNTCTPGTPATNYSCCNSSANAYAIQFKLVSPQTTTYFCVDSTGFAGNRTSDLTAGSTQCPAS